MYKDSQLHNLGFMVEVGNQKPTQEQEAKRSAGEEVALYTEVKKIFDVNGNAPTWQERHFSARTAPSKLHRLPNLHPTHNLPNLTLT